MLRQGFRAFDLDDQCTWGRVVLLFPSASAAPQVWFQDLGRNWFFVAKNFTDYLRLVIMHLGLPNWHYAYSAVGLDCATKQWFRFLSVERLAIDVDHLALVHEAHPHPAGRKALLPARPPAPRRSRPLSRVQRRQVFRGELSTGGASRMPSHAPTGAGRVREGAGEAGGGEGAGAVGVRLRALENLERDALHRRTGPSGSPRCPARPDKPHAEGARRRVAAAPGAAQAAGSGAGGSGGGGRRAGGERLGGAAPRRPPLAGQGAVSGARGAGR